VVLEVLAEVVRRTEGRVTTLTKAQADLIPIFHAAFEGSIGRADGPDPRRDKLIVGMTVVRRETERPRVRWRGVLRSDSW
jgi:hypothetical protein